MPEKLFISCIQTLRHLNPELELTVLCHQGGEAAGCRSVVYPGEGFFRLEDLDSEALQRKKFDLVVLPYAANSRLSPYYQNVDRVAEEQLKGRFSFSTRMPRRIWRTRNSCSASARATVNSSPDWAWR